MGSKKCRCPGILETTMRPPTCMAAEAGLYLLFIRQAWLGKQALALKVGPRTMAVMNAGAAETN